MKALLDKLPSDAMFIRIGIALEILGIAVLSIPFYVKIPLLMTFCIPGGAGLLALGWACWAWSFLKNL